MLSVTHKNIQSIARFVGIPPADAYIKVNVDGSSFGNPKNAGFGGLLRNHYGGWTQGFYGSRGRASNWFVELLAILGGLQLTLELGYQSIILESNSKAALDLIAIDHQNEFQPHTTIISLIKKLSALSWMVSFSHTLREDN